jgi:mxaJ protein
MPRYGLLMLAAFCFCSLYPARAEMSGREKIDAAKSEFRVCADPDSLPFSNRRGEGFGNQIAELLARSAGQPLVYYWWPMRRGFISRTLNAWECDVVLDVPTGYDLTRTTQPYYCSRYVMVYRPGERLAPSFFEDPRARSLRIGVVEHTPPLDLALQHKVDPVVYFTDYDGASNYPGRIVDDVGSGKLDVALVWGPIGGYFARRQSVPLQMAALEPGGVPNVRLTFPVSFGVRRGDKPRAERLEALMHEHADEIAAILRDHGVPLVDDPAECQSTPQHAGRESAAPAQRVADAARDSATSSAKVELAAAAPSETPPSRVEPVAEQSEEPRGSQSDNITCKGSETMEEIQKLGGGPPDAGHPYTVRDGKADAKTYSGWVRFAAFCQVCHGPGAVGSALAPDLAQKVKDLNHKQFVTIVSCGLKGNLGTGVMPAWGDNPNIKPYLEDLWAYLRARADGALGPGRPQKLTTSK